MLHDVVEIRTRGNHGPGANYLPKSEGEDGERQEDGVEEAGEELFAREKVGGEYVFDNSSGIGDRICGSVLRE